MERDEIDLISKELEDMLGMAKQYETDGGTDSDIKENMADDTLPDADLTSEVSPKQCRSRKRRKSSRMPEPEHLKSPEQAKMGAAFLMRPSDGLLAAFLVPVIIMIIIFIQRGIFPFGENSFLRTDMYHQYAPFFSEFQQKLTNGGSLLYSWDVGMGVNFAALYAYYLASPLNWLLIFCPKGFIIEFMTYMIVLKIGLSGLSFAYYLKKHCKTSDIGVAFFGIFYALSGYMAAYSWNIMWLDCIFLFPLIVLGLERLVRERKCFLYSITLGLAILSNYYISIMICVFMVLYFIALLLLDHRKTIRDYLINLVQFSFFSLMAGGFAAIVLLPEIFALQTTASGDVNFPKTYESYFSIFDMIARHIGNVETEIGLDHWPNIYCGVAVLMFFLLYLGCKKIRLKEKVVYCGLLLIFFASFSINVLNFLWHGFHYPNSLPCRQSFIYVFLILFVSYRAYSYLKETPWKHVVTAFWGAVCFVLLAQKLVDNSAFHFIVFYVAILFLGIYAGIIYLYHQNKSKILLVLLTLAVVAVEAAVNTTVTSVTTTSRTSYIRDNEAVRNLVEKLNPAPTFYRIEKVDRKTKNDGAWMNFPSVSLFSSTANADLSDFFKKIGCESSTNAYSITGSTPLVDSLFSVRYGLYSEEAADTGLITLLDEQDHTYLYENSYTLPVAFVVPWELEDSWRIDLGNPAQVQNDLSAVLGVDPVLEEVQTDLTGTSFQFTALQAGDYYVYVNNKKIEKVTASIGENSKSFSNVNRGFFLELGYINAGEEVMLKSDSEGQDLVASVYRFSPDGLKAVYDSLNQSPMSVNLWTDTAIGGTVNAEKSGMLFTSIPYDQGWTAYLDGEKQDTRKIFDTFLSIEMPSGRHTVEFVYMPEGVMAGAVITGGSIGMLLLTWLLQMLLNKRRVEKEFIEESTRREEL